MADQSHRSGQEKSPSPSRPRERASSAAFPPPAQSSLTPGAAPAPIPGHRDRRHGDGDANQQGAAQLRWASHLISSPPNAAPPIPPSLPVGELTGNPGQANAGLALDRESATALFSHAALLFHAYCWNMSLKLYRSIIRRSLTFNGNGSDGSDIAAPIPRPLQMAHLWVNVGIIRCHLGEYALAVESFDRAVDHDQHLAVAWFLMGMALFELQDFRRAERRYKMSLSCFDSELNETADNEPPAESKGVNSTTTRIDYRPDGLNFVLERSRVEFNIRLSMLWKLHRQVNAERPPSWSLNRLPAGIVFEPMASSSGGGSRPALRRVKSLLPVEEREVLSRTPEERAAVRFVGTRSTPAAQTSGSTSGPAGKAPASSTSTPTRTPAREETAAPSPAPADADTPSRGKFRPLLREKVLPWLRRLQSHDKETDSTGVGSSSSEPRRFFGKRSASSPQTTTLSAQPENNATSSAANDGGAGRRRRVVDSIALFAPSTHIDSGGDDANAVAQTVPSEAPGTPSATGARPHSSQFKPLPTLPPLPPLPTLSTLPTFPTLNPTSSSATAPGSATADPGESDRSGANYPSRSLPSPLVLDPFIAERRHSAFLRLNTARPPGPTPDVPVETMLRILNAERERRPGQDEVEDVMETQPPTTAPAPGISRVARAEGSSQHPPNINQRRVERLPTPTVAPAPSIGRVARAEVADRSSPVVHRRPAERLPTPAATSAPGAGRVARAEGADHPPPVIHRHPAEWLHTPAPADDHRATETSASVEEARARARGHHRAVMDSVQIFELGRQGPLATTEAPEQAAEAPTRPPPLPPRSARRPAPQPAPSGQRRLRLPWDDSPERDPSGQ